MGDDQSGKSYPPRSGIRQQPPWGSAMTRVPFGKYRGRLLSELPNDYLEWLYSRQNIREPLRSQVDAEYERRRINEEERGTELVPGELLAMAEEVVKIGFRNLARRYHPDSGGSHERMTELNRAVEFLRKGLERAA